MLEILGSRSFDSNGSPLLAFYTEIKSDWRCPYSTENSNIGTKMPEEKESSVLFNLRELMNIEEDRVREEEEARIRREAEERERIAAEARQREEEAEAQRRAEEEERLTVERLHREEEERILRERQEAELRVRLEEEARAKAEEHQRVLEHEREIAQIHAQRRGVHPGLLAAAAVLVIGLGAGAYFGIYRPAVERREAAALSAKMEAEREAREAEKARQAAKLADEKRAKAEQDAETARAERDRQAAIAARKRASQPKPTQRRTPQRRQKATDSDDPLAGLDSL